MNSAYDFDGVITEGIIPEQGSTVITGNTMDTEAELRTILKRMGMEDMPIEFYPSKAELDKNPDKINELVGQHKAATIKRLNISTFYEDSQEQIDIIKELNPDIKVIKISDESPKTVLYVAHDFSAPDLALRIKNEGHRVLLANENEIDFLEGTIERVPFKDRMNIAKDADLAIYDDTGFGDEPMKLRDEGVSVVGGSKQADDSEMDRIKGALIAEQAGIQTPKMYEIGSFDEAKKFLEKNKGRWVLKQCGDLDDVKALNYAAKRDDSEDLREHIDWLESIWVEGLPQTFILQEFVEGHEFAAGAYWNGYEFMKDEDGDEVVEENFEHKALMPGDLGTSTGEMFTLMRYRKANESKLFRETLDKMRPWLKQSGFRGDFDINCKVNEKGVWFLEWTPRMGVPATSGQIAIHLSAWYDFLKACADGKQTKFRWDKRWTVVAWLYTSPFPSSTPSKLRKLIEEKYQKSPPSDEQGKKELLEARMADSRNIVIGFKEPLTGEELKNVHFDAVKYKDGKLCVANDGGWVLTVTGKGESPHEAGEATEKLLRKFVVPKGFWRNDFTSHYDKACGDLTEWGYLEGNSNEPMSMKGEGMKDGMETIEHETEMDIEAINDEIEDILHGGTIS